jgi:hypothetical protein
MKIKKVIKRLLSTKEMKVKLRSGMITDKALYSWIPSTNQWCFLKEAVKVNSKIRASGNVGRYEICHTSWDINDSIKPFGQKNTSHLHKSDK